jgi:hypothetical protein
MDGARSFWEEKNETDPSSEIFELLNDLSPTTVQMSGCLLLRLYDYKMTHDKDNKLCFPTIKNLTVASGCCRRDHCYSKDASKRFCLSSSMFPSLTSLGIVDNDTFARTYMDQYTTLTRRPNTLFLTEPNVILPFDVCTTLVVMPRYISNLPNIHFLYQLFDMNENHERKLQSIFLSKESWISLFRQEQYWIKYLCKLPILNTCLRGINKFRKTQPKAFDTLSNIYDQAINNLCRGSSLETKSDNTKNTNNTNNSSEFKLRIVGPVSTVDFDVRTSTFRYPNGNQPKLTLLYRLLRNNFVTVLSD